VNIVGCSSTPSKPSHASTTLNFGNPGKPNAQQTALSRHYKTWKSTPYKLGGLSKSGIDCSGFVHVTYRDVFKRKLPRSTELLAKTGDNIKQKSLKFGDLVFFKTGRSKRHVGIYINNGKFIHASSSRGVMQSSLRSDYWSRNYWMAKRIF
jgi:cell wall-associated NlpC family hydrolase